MTEPITVEQCGCEARYSIEPHSDGYVLYYGRCAHQHGYNLATIDDPAWNFDPEFVELLLNLGRVHYWKDPTGGHIAE